MGEPFERPGNEAFRCCSSKDGQGGGALLDRVPPSRADIDRKLQQLGAPMAEPARRPDALQEGSAFSGQASGSPSRLHPVYIQTSSSGAELLCNGVRV